MSDKKFPQDCTTKCQHFHTWDMSVDDWTCVCDKLGVQIDDCDSDFQWMYCPLSEDDEKNTSKTITLELNSSELFLIREMMSEAQANPYHPGDYQDEKTERLIRKITNALNESYG